MLPAGIEGRFISTLLTEGQRPDGTYALGDKQLEESVFGSYGKALTAPQIREVKQLTQRLNGTIERETAGRARTLFTFKRDELFEALEIIGHDPSQVAPADGAFEEVSDRSVSQADDFLADTPAFLSLQ
jgi:hypothetical protein